TASAADLAVVVTLLARVEDTIAAQRLATGGAGLRSRRTGSGPEQRKAENGERSEEGGGRPPRWDAHGVHGKKYTRRHHRTTDGWESARWESDVSGVALMRIGTPLATPHACCNCAATGTNVWY